MGRANLLWLYFRISVGVVLLVMFVYLILTKSFDTDLISRLLMLLVSVLTTGDGVLAIRAARRKQT